MLIARKIPKSRSNCYPANFYCEVKKKEEQILTKHSELDALQSGLLAVSLMSHDSPLKYVMLLSQFYR